MRTGRSGSGCIDEGENQKVMELLISADNAVIVLGETPGFRADLGLIEWLTDFWCKSIIYNMFLFEWKASP